jgi:hypothetical protein
MSILRFLGVVDATGLLSGESPPVPPHRRKLTLETLDSRALLTLLTPLETDTSAESEEVLTTESQTGTWEEQSTGSEGGTGETTGETTDDAPAESTVDSSAGGSAGGDGGEDGQLSIGSGGGSGGGEGGTQLPGSGSGGGEGGTAPEITSAEYERTDSYVDFSGTVTDDESMLGLVVYFVADSGQQFSATIDAEGRFATCSIMLDVGTQVSIYTIDADGNQSDWIMRLV